MVHKIKGKEIPFVGDPERSSEPIRHKQCQKSRSTSLGHIQGYLLPCSFLSLLRSQNWWRKMLVFWECCWQLCIHLTSFPLLLCADTHCWVLHLFSTWEEGRLLLDLSAALDTVYYFLLLILLESSSLGSKGSTLSGFQPTSVVAPIHLLLLVPRLLLDSCCWNDSVLNPRLFSIYLHGDHMQSHEVCKWLI